jgi:twitching motility protein PilT
MPDIDELFDELVERGGSDLHLRVGRTPLIRADGDMASLEGRPEQSQEVLHSLLMEIMPQRNREEYDEVHDTDFSYEIPGKMRLRCNVGMDRFGITAVFRVIPFEVIPFDKLGLPRAAWDLCMLSKGLVVVTGPTGSGKSTTLAAMIDLINQTRPAHIITIEDPVEFVHPDKLCLVTQREVHNHTASFSGALRAALRQDPDMVLVGEMRDLETIEIAIETAETGHLVFGTLHTTTAASTMDRIIDSFPEGRQNQIRAMLSNSLKGVIAQVLLKRVAGGRVAGLEILIVDRGISSMIRDGKIHQIPSAMQVGGALGMITLNDSLCNLIADGTVATDEAYLKAVDKDDLVTKLNGRGLPLPTHMQQG